jgi:hypothetical protein
MFINYGIWSILTNSRKKIHIKNDRKESMPPTSNFKKEILEGIFPPTLHRFVLSFFPIKVQITFICLPAHLAQLMDDILQAGKNYDMVLLTCNFGERIINGIRIKNKMNDDKLICTVNFFLHQELHFCGIKWYIALKSTIHEMTYCNTLVNPNQVSVSVPETRVRCQ